MGGESVDDRGETEVGRGEIACGGPDGTQRPLAVHLPPSRAVEGAVSVLSVLMSRVCAGTGRVLTHSATYTHNVHNCTTV